MRREPFDGWEDSVQRIDQLFDPIAALKPSTLSLMARETTMVLIDDLDGSEAHHRITFAYLDRRYEIDLSTDNAETFFNLILPYIEAGRPARPDADDAAAAAPSRDLTQIRRWARENGHAVSDRGRIARRVRTAYDESVRQALAEAP